MFRSNLFCTIQMYVWNSYFQCQINIFHGMIIEFVHVYVFARVHACVRGCLPAGVRAWMCGLLHVLDFYLWRLGCFILSSYLVVQLQIIIISMNTIISWNGNDTCITCPHRFFTVHWCVYLLWSKVSEILDRLLSLCKILPILRRQW